jgi:hypothetical protein
MAKTIVSIPSQGTESPAMGGSFSEAQVRAMFAPQVQGLANMVATATNSTDAEGPVTTWVFQPRTGNKG